MASKVIMPKLSPTMEEGQIARWLKKEGDKVSMGEPLAEIDTDKATMEMQALANGVLRKILIGEGESAPLGQLIAVIGDANEDIASILAEAPAAAPAAPAKKEPEPEAKQPEPVKAEEPPPPPPPQPAPTNGQQTVRADSGRMIVSPLAARMAADSGLDLRSIQGSGPNGRIIKRDIEAALTKPKAAAAAVTATASGYRDEPATQIRQTIAKRLVTSIGPVPHFFLTVEIDMEESMRLRGRINERFADKGVKVSPNDLIIKAVAAALRKHPWVNASWTGEAIRFHDQVHIGVAVAVDEGLITPVVRDADRKGVAEIATEVRELAGRAREKKLKPEEYTGSTFSLSNLGMFGIEEFTAVINPPEAAILAVGAIAPKVVVDPKGEMAVRQRMRVTLSCDHRVIDGATGAQFLETLKGYLEDPMLMIA